MTTDDTTQGSTDPNVGAVVTIHKRQWRILRRMVSGDYLGREVTASKLFPFEMMFGARVVTRARRARSEAGKEGEGNDKG